MVKTGTTLELRNIIRASDLFFSLLLRPFSFLYFFLSFFLKSFVNLSFDLFFLGLLPTYHLRPFFSLSFLLVVSRNLEPGSHSSNRLSSPSLPTAVHAFIFIASRQNPALSSLGDSRRIWVAGVCCVVLAVLSTMAWLGIALSTLSLLHYNVESLRRSFMAT